MAKFLKKCYNWLKESSRWKHLIGGFLIGLGAKNWYCAGYVAVVVASALEIKDKSWGGKWDWSDWIMTVVGTVLGYSVYLLAKILLF